MKTLRIFWAVMIAIAAMQTPARCQDLDGGDLTGTTTVKPGSWDLVVTKFYMQPRSQHTQTPLKLTNQKGFPNLIQQWSELKDLVKTRRDNTGKPIAYDAKAEMISGWKVDDDGLDFQIHRMGGDEGKKMQSVLKVESVSITADFDVLMPTSLSERDSRLSKYFDVLEYSVTVHEVPGGDKDPRAAAKEEMVGGYIAKQTFAADDRAPGQNWGRKSDIKGEWIPRVAGLYEIRFKVKVRGRLEYSDTPEIQTIESSIRIVAIDQGISIEKLSYESVKKVLKRR